MSTEGVAEGGGGGTALFGPYDFTGTEADVWPSIHTSALRMSAGVLARLPLGDEPQLALTMARPCTLCGQVIEFTLRLEAPHTIAVIFPQTPAVQHQVCPEK